jgi:hypothetical protein
LALLPSCQPQRLLKYREHNREKDLFEIMQIETKDDAQWQYHSVFSGAKKANAVDEEWSQSGGKLIPDENSSKEMPLKSKLEKD